MGNYEYIFINIILCLILLFFYPKIMFYVYGYWAALSEARKFRDKSDGLWDHKNNAMWNFYTKTLFNSIDNAVSKKRSYPSEEISTITQGFIFIFRLRRCLQFNSNIDVPDKIEAHYNSDLINFIWENPNIELKISIERKEKDYFEYSYYGVLKQAEIDGSKFSIKEAGKPLSNRQDPDFHELMDLFRRIT